MNIYAMTLKIKSIFDWIASSVSTQKLYGLCITDLVIGGNLLKILKGIPIIKINITNGKEIIKPTVFFRIFIIRLLLNY